MDLIKCIGLVPPKLKLEKVPRVIIESLIRTSLEGLGGNDCVEIKRCSYLKDFSALLKYVRSND